MISGLDHVQLAIPRGGEEAARAFYGGVLGLDEREKPFQLLANGGLWFEGEGLQLHLGVEADFEPGRKAHVALIVRDLDGLGMNLRAAGASFEPDDRVPGRTRAYTADPFGNRIELIADGDGFSQRR
ncbi:MAG TPA: VOC family protein [Actinomycetota bacterium]|nr:VOC family protein [Actinomycetota bacterium]